MPLGRVRDYGDARYAGCECETEDVECALREALDGGFDFILAPLSLPRDAHTPPGVPRPPIPRADFLLSSSAWSSQVVGRVSTWIQPDSDDALLRTHSEQALRAELAWAAHLSLQAVVVPVPSGRCANYARVTNSLLGSLSHTAIWARLPLLSPALADAEGTHAEEALIAERDPCTGARTHDSWEWWHRFRAACDSHCALGCVLDIGPSLPSDAECHRWLGEPLKAVVVSTSSFLSNKRGFPVLPRRHQELLLLLLKSNVQLLLRGEALHAPASAPASLGDGDGDGDAQMAPTERGAEGAPPAPPPPHPLAAYWEYLAYLFAKLEPLSDQERLEAGYRDYLQAPLQPLMDNLESQTYETFEKDHTKYSTYEEAVFCALQDLAAPTPAQAGEAVVVMVVGAGRGPLVKASLRAGVRAGRALRVYAVEKNPNALVHLRALHARERWGGTVTLVAHDMRTWAAPESAQIMVSELLGSFGDNELSPECLDGAQRFLAVGGVCIPQSYTSFLAPVTAWKLWSDVKAHGDLAHFETPYVVKLHRVAPLSEALPVFTFRHPNPEQPVDNTRALSLRFQRAADAPGQLMHGFAGYFDAVLYKHVHLSIYPPTATANMFSWFPIFFPLRAPVHVPAGAAVEATLWRCGDGAKVWYEWAATAPQATAVHNPNGRSYFVGL